MNSPSRISCNNPSNINDSARCQHRTATGKRCRLHVVDPRTGLCFRHASDRLTQPSANLRVALAGELQDFKSAAEINDFLSRLLLLLSEDRIPPRRGAVLAYVCNLLLRTLPAMDREANPDSGDDFPRLNFEGVMGPDPSPSYPESAPEDAGYVRPQT